MGIQMGDVTHHQLQLIVLVSFKTKNIKNSTVPSPIPFDVFLFWFIFLCFILQLIRPN